MKKGVKYKVHYVEFDNVVFFRISYFKVEPLSMTIRIDIVLQQQIIIFHLFVLAYISNTKIPTFEFRIKNKTRMPR